VGERRKERPVDGGEKVTWLSEKRRPQRGKLGEKGREIREVPQKKKSETIKAQEN